MPIYSKRFFFESHIFLDSYHAKVVHADAVITLIVIVDTCKLLSYKHANKNLILCLLQISFTPKTHSCLEQMLYMFSTGNNRN